MHRTDLAKHLLDDTSCSVLLYDYQGYGTSSGKPSVKGILKDGLCVFDYAVNELGYKDNQVTVYGESLGCAVTCYLAANRHPRAMILQSPFRSLPSIAKDVCGPLKMLPQAVFPEPRLNNEDVLKGKHAPLLIMHGTHDEVIPVEHGKRLYSSASEPKKFVLLERSSHNDTYIADAELFDKTLRDFFKDLPSGNEATQN